MKIWLGVITGLLVILIGLVCRLNFWPPQAVQSSTPTPVADFEVGINYAWNVFGGDFGGIGQWNQDGVSKNLAAYEADFKIMSQYGIKTVRWWVWPEFRTDGIVFDGDKATQITDESLRDLDAALAIAAKYGIKIMFTLFSFDGARPTRVDSGLLIRGYGDVLFSTADNQRNFLLNVVKPFAEQVARHSNRSAVHSWDLINEPEWAVKGPNKYAHLIDSEWSSGYGESFDDQPRFQQVTHDQMETLLINTRDVLRQITPEIPITVGSAAVKWGTSAWSGIDVDFHSVHIYDWVNDQEVWSYDKSPEELGYSGCKPVMMSEYPIDGLRANSRHGQVAPKDLLQTLRGNGFSGAMAWDFTLTKQAGEAVLRQKLEQFEDFRDVGCN